MKKSHTPLQVVNVMEVHINTGKFASHGVENGKPYVFRGVSWRYVHRLVEELRRSYRAKFGRRGHAVKVWKLHDRERHPFARIAVFAVSA